MTFPAKRIAEVAAVTTSELLAMHPRDFGVPGHWQLVGSNVVYTAKGVRALADEFALAGRHTSAALLRVLVDTREEDARLVPFPAASESWLNRWEKEHDS